MTRIFAVANVGDDEEVGRGLLDRADRVLNDAGFIVSAGRMLVLVRWNAKEDNATNSQRVRFLTFLDGIIDRDLRVQASRRSLSARPRPRPRTEEG